jgi:WD40 repeat protein
MSQPASAKLAAGRRLLVATAVSHYAKNPAWDRPGLTAARQQVIDLFTGTLGYTHLSEIGLDPTASQLTEHLRTVCRHRVQAQDYLVVYIAGHGEVLDDGGHVLLTADTDPDDVNDALPTVTLARKMLLGTNVQRLMLLLDTCYSGQGGNEFAAEALAGQRDWAVIDRSGLVVITSTQPFEQADTGAFPTLLTQAVEGLPTAGQVPVTLALGAVVRAMNSNQARPAHQKIGMTTLGLTGEEPDFLPNPRHRPGMTDIDLHLQQVAEWETHAERREVEFRRRFLVRAMGGHGPEPTWWFSGRHTALTDITTWLATPAQSSPALVVTAGPGSGKTAVLGMVSALTHPEHRRTVPRDALALPRQAIPPVGAVDVTIYAGGLTHEQVLAGLAAAAHVHADTIGQLITALRQPPVRADRPFTAIIDALDEAADPHRLITQVLRPLIDDEQAIRLLLGTRPHLLTPLTPTTTPGTRTVVATIELDEPRYADRDALTAYTVRGLLEASPDSPYQHIPPARARIVAEAVAAAADPSFLVARITSTTLAAAETVADPTDARWRANLPRLPGDAMRTDLDTRLGEHAQRARDLLRPLAYAEGQGLPWENIWAPLATKISGHLYTDDDLFWLREHVGSYVVEANEDGRSAYRLYHQALTEHLRANTEAAGITAAAVQQAFVDVLTRVPRTPQATRDWTRAHPYALRHLATHAAAAGTIDTLLADGDYLVHADPDTLIPALAHARTVDGRLIRTVYRASANLHRHADPTVRRQLLAFDSARCGADALRERLGADLPLHLRWATGNLVSAALRAILTGHGESVNAVACTEVDGVPIAITGSGTANAIFEGVGEVVVWDLRTGQQRAILAGHTESVRAVACTEVDGVPIAVTCSGRRGTPSGFGEVLVWDLQTGRQRATRTGHTGLVHAVACTEVDGVPIAVTCGGDYDSGEVLVWDLRTGRQRATLTDHPQSAYAVACTEVDGVPIAIICGGDSDVTGDVQVWDLRAGQKRATLIGHTQSVRAVACTEVDGVPIAITGSCNYHYGPGEVLVWNLRTGQQYATLTGHTKQVFSVACTEVDGAPVAITGGGNDDSNEVLVWDLRGGQQRAALTGHVRSVCAVACTEVDGAPVAITGGGGFGPGEIQVSDLRAAQQRVIPTGHTESVNAVACTEVDGIPIAITGGENLGVGGEVLVWDLRTGQQRATLAGHTNGVFSVACTEVDGVPIAITCAGNSESGEVLVWDLRTSQQRAILTTSFGPLRAVACTNVDGVPVAITCDGKAVVWDLRTGRKRATLTRHTQSAYAVACTEVDGVPIAITCGGDFDVSADVLVWDLRTGQQRATPTRHTQSVRAVACTEVDGVPVAVALTRSYNYHDDSHEWGLGAPVSITRSGNDESCEVLVWDLRTGQQYGTITGRGWTVNALACTEVDGAPVVITGGGLGSGEVQLWDLRTGRLHHAFATPYPVNAVTRGPTNEIVLGTAREVAVLELGPSA